MFEVGRLVARITLEGGDQVARQLRSLKAEWAGMSHGAQEAAATMGRPMILAGAGLVAMLGLATKAAISWESAWAGVTKTVEGSPRQLAAVEAGLRGLTRVLPATHEEIAGVAEAAGQLGVQTGNVVAFTRTMVDLGETTNLSADEASDALARFMNIMGTSQADVRNLGSAVVDLGNKYAATESEIVSMAQRLAGAGVQVGLTEGEVLGLATALTSVGIEAEAGGTAMSRTMIEISAAVEQGGDKMAKFAEVAGLGADEFAQKWRTKPSEALSLFVQGLANAESQGGSTLGMLEELGITEIRQRDALLRAAAASDMFTAAMQEGNQAFEDGTALQDEATKRYQTLESQLQITANALRDAAIDFGQVFMPAVAGAALMVRDFANFMGDLPAELQGAIGVFTLLTGAVLIFGGVLLVTVPKIIAFRAAMALMAAEMPLTMNAMKGVTSFLTGPWGVALAAAVVGVLILQDAVKSMATTTAEWQNMIVNSPSADKLFEAAASEQLIARFDAVGASTETLRGLLGDLDNEFLAGLPAQASFRSTLQAIGEQLTLTAESDFPAAHEAFLTLAQDMDLNEQETIALLEQMEPYREKLVELATQQGINVTSGTELQQNQALLKFAFDETSAGARTAAEAYMETTTQVDTLADELGKLIEKFMEANGQNVSAVEQNARYQESLANVSTEINRQRDAFIEAHGTADGFSASLDANTVEGSKNAAMLAGVAEEAQSAAAAQFEVDVRTMGAKRATELYVERLQEGRTNLINAANAAGFNAGQVQNLTDRVYQMPTQREIRIFADTSSARWRLDELLAAYQNRSITLRAYMHYVDQQANGGFSFFANGGTHFAGGGSWGRIREDHMAQIGSYGRTRIWNEPETGGEAYIPLGSGKRNSAETVFETVAKMFGYNVSKPDKGNAPETTMIQAKPQTEKVLQPIILQMNGREISRTLLEYERSIS
jgi:TP901 family phage tail tape measure protein